MADPIETVLLASGLSVLKANSFSRQLRLLKRFLERAGISVLLAGKASGSEGNMRVPRLSGLDPDPGIFDIPDFSTGAVNELISRSGITAIILLGYPDQFPFLLDGGAVDVYFWYQCSRPTVPAGLESTIVVPLTPMTAAHLENAGFSRVWSVIPHGVDTEVFRPAGTLAGLAREGRPGGQMLLSVGANSRRKRFDVLIEAFSRVRKRLPKAHLRIKTDSNNKPGGFDLGKLLTRHGVSGAVSVISGELSDAEMASLYVSSDIYVHTAEWEGFCIPVIEAMACGLPVVTHPVQGPGELVPYPDLLVSGSKIIEHGWVDLLIADPESFANAVVKYAKDAEIICFASTAGRRAAVERFDIRKVAEKWRLLLSSS